MRAAVKISQRSSIRSLIRIIKKVPIKEKPRIKARSRKFSKAQHNKLFLKFKNNPNLKYFNPNQQYNKNNNHSQLLITKPWYHWKSSKRKSMNHCNSRMKETNFLKPTNSKKLFKSILKVWQFSNPNNFMAQLKHNAKKWLKLVQVYSSTLVCAFSIPADGNKRKFTSTKLLWSIPIILRPFIGERFVDFIYKTMKRQWLISSKPSIKTSQMFKFTRLTKRF